MAVLSAEERRRAWAQLMRAWPAELGPIPVAKHELRAALDATDTWIDGQQAAFNAALPQPFRTAATLEQKTLLFCYDAMRRAGLLKAEEDAGG